MTLTFNLSQPVAVKENKERLYAMRADLLLELLSHFVYYTFI